MCTLFKRTSQFQTYFRIALLLYCVKSTMIGSVKSCNYFYVNINKCELFQSRIAMKLRNLFLRLAPFHSKLMHQDTGLKYKIVHRSWLSIRNTHLRVARASVTRWGNLLDFGQILKPLATINFPKSPTLLGNFCKDVKIYHFSSEIIFGQLL